MSGEEFCWCYRWIMSRLVFERLLVHVSYYERFAILIPQGFSLKNFSAAGLAQRIERWRAKVVGHGFDPRARTNTQGCKITEKWTCCLRPAKRLDLRMVLGKKIWRNVFFSLGDMKQSLRGVQVEQDPMLSKLKGNCFLLKSGFIWFSLARTFFVPRPCFCLYLYVAKLYHKICTCSCYHLICFSSILCVRPFSKDDICCCQH